MLLASEAFKLTPEDDYRLGRYIRKNVGSNVKVVLATARQLSSSGLYCENNPSILAPGTESAAYRHLLEVSGRLAQSGLTNIEVLDPRIGIYNPQ